MCLPVIFNSLSTHNFRSIYKRRSSVRFLISNTANDTAAVGSRKESINLVSRMIRSMQSNGDFMKLLIAFTFSISSNLCQNEELILDRYSQSVNPQT